MSRPGRRPAALPEATQELRASDALELLETGSVPGQVIALTRASRKKSSQPSIAPVGLDLRVAAAAQVEEDADSTGEVQLPSRRRLLGGFVVGGAIALCSAILVAAVAHARHAAVDPEVALSTTVTPVDSPAAAPPVADPSSPPAAPAATDSAPAADATGTLRIERPALPSRVVVDGKRLTSSPVTLSCGTHQLRVGRGRLHSIVVPCGGEVVVSR